MNKTAELLRSLIMNLRHPERSAVESKAESARQAKPNLPTAGRQGEVSAAGRKVFRLRPAAFAQDDSVFYAALILISFVFLALPNADAEPAKPEPTPAAANRAPSGPATYDSFRLIHTRNVFDPDRRPIRPPGLNAPQTVTATQADYAALTGTMVSTEKTYAFFSGSRPEFNKVLGVGSQFVRATIASITAQSIEIERDGKRTTILVGQTVPFDNLTAPGEPPVEATPPPETAAASVSAPAATSAPAYSYRTGNYGGYRGGGFGGGGNNNTAANTPAPAAGAANAPKGPPANVEEIRRRMMEKRQQELK